MFLIIISYFYVFDYNVTMNHHLSESEINLLLKKYRFDNSERGFHRLSLEYENKALYKVKEGKYLEINPPKYEDIKNNLGITAKDSKRAFEYDVVSAIALFSRAAIEGSVSADEVFDLSDVLLQKVEQLNTIEELYQLYQDAEILFAKLVSDSRRKTRSYKIERCKMYVAKNIYNKISVNEIAKHVELSPNYLSKVFKAEEGIGLNDYIQKEKIKIASIILSQTVQPISLVSHYLGFKSQSNFIEVFKKWTSMTPLEYRNKYFTEVVDI